MKVAVYTCITQGYDELNLPTHRCSGVDFYCFTDDPSKVRPPFIYRDTACKDLNPAEQNRFIKMHPHLILSAYDASVYVDGNIQVIGDVGSLARESLTSAKIAAYSHPERDCVYDEAKACALLGLEWVHKIAEQVKLYEHQRFPRHHGLVEANILFRRHNDHQVIKVMEFWWTLFQRYAKRDQLSFNYACWQQGLEIHNLGRHDARFRHEYFLYKSRSGKRTTQRTMVKAFNRIVGPVLFNELWNNGVSATGG